MRPFTYQRLPQVTTAYQDLPSTYRTVTVHLPYPVSICGNFDFRPDSAR
jgi:hypothetical protein